MPLFEETILFPLNSLGTLAKNQLALDVGFISGFLFLFHYSLSNLMLVLQHWWLSLQSVLRSGMWGPPNFFSPSKWFCLLRSFATPYKFEGSLFHFWKKKKATGILIRITLNLSIALGSINILTIWSFLTHEDGRAFHLFRPSFISFRQCFVASSAQSLTSWVKFIFRYLSFWMIL